MDAIYTMSSKRASPNSVFYLQMMSRRSPVLGQQPKADPAARLGKNRLTAPRCCGTFSSGSQNWVQGRGHRFAVAFFMRRRAA